MTERPILFSAPMVRALLADTKTQTRRVVKPQPAAGLNWVGWCLTSTHTADEGKATWARGEGPHLVETHRVRCPYGQPGDRLWGRETWRGIVKTSAPWDDCTTYGVAHYVPDQDECRRIEYAATFGEGAKGWRPSIHMPRWASRITLEITSVRVERLQDISDADAWSEGISFDDYTYCGGCKDAPRAAYQMLWESINGPASWDANPWVWVVEFRRLP